MSHLARSFVGLSYVHEDGNILPVEVERPRSDDFLQVEYPFELLVDHAGVGELSNTHCLARRCRQIAVCFLWFAPCIL